MSPAETPRWRRIAWWLASALAVVLVAAVAAVTWAYPSVGAITCPTCYGLERVADHLYIEKDSEGNSEEGPAAARRRELRRIVRTADRRIAAFYGTRDSRPDVLACLTAECYRRIGGGRERGIAVLNRAVMLSPRGFDPVIATHEMAHVELHHRLTSGEVPQWFDEGLAVVIADDRRYLRSPSAEDRCRVAPDTPLPGTLEEWLSAASADDDLYAKAACRVVRWLDKYGGRSAIGDLIDRLNRGEPFVTAIDR